MRVSNANNYDRCPRKLLPAQKINRHDVRGERRKHNLVQTFFLMDKIFTSSLVSHRGKKWVLICFDRDAEWNRRMKTVEGSRWSNTYKGWIVPDSADNRKKCKINAAATVPMAQIVTSLPQKTAPGNIAVAVEQKLGKENRAALEKFIELLKLRAYSESTIRTYRNEFMQLLQLLKKKPASELTPDDLKRYMVYAMEKEGIAENTAHSRLNALYPVGLKY